MTYFPNITDEYNVDSPDATDAWVDAINEVYEQFSITTPFHVWENGFVQGEASDEEEQEHANRIAGGDVERMYKIINSKLANIYHAKLEKLDKDINLK